MNLHRRNWLKNAAGLLVAAPFVARAGVLMPVTSLARRWTPHEWETYVAFDLAAFDRSETAMAAVYRPRPDGGFELLDLARPGDGGFGPRVALLDRHPRIAYDGQPAKLRVNAAFKVAALRGLERLVKA